MRPRKPFQFSLAALMWVVTAYAILFGLLRCMGLNNPTFVIVTLYFTTVVYCQWALFGGRNPALASACASGGLFAVAAIAFGATDLWKTAGRPYLNVIGATFLLVPVFLFGGVVGVGVAGMMDIGLSAYHRMRGVGHNALEPKASPPQSPPDSEFLGDGTPSRGIRLAVLAVLASMFFAAMLWGILTRQIPLW
jgi:hypothetical protein